MAARVFGRPFVFVVKAFRRSKDAFEMLAQQTNVRYPERRRHQTANQNFPLSVPAQHDTGPCDEGRKNQHRHACPEIGRKHQKTQVCHYQRVLRDFDFRVDGITNGHEQGKKQRFAHKRLAKKVEQCRRCQQQYQHRAVNIAGALALCRHVPVRDFAFSFSEKQKRAHDSKASPYRCQRRPRFFKRKLPNRQQRQNHRQQQERMTYGREDGGGGFCHGAFVKGVR